MANQDDVSRSFRAIFGGPPEKVLTPAEIEQRREEKLALLGPATSAVGATAYTVAREAEGKNAAQEWLIAYDEVKLILDNTVKVGTHEGRNTVFNKREAAAKITQIVNDRYNAKRGA